MPRLRRTYSALGGRRRGAGTASRLALVVLLVALSTGLVGDDDNWEADLAGFRSRPDLRPPEVSVETSTDASLSRDIFVAPWRGEGQAGPMILDQRGELIWFHPVPPEKEAMNFRVQHYQGRSVLTWWEGFVDKDGYGHGEYVIADHSYHEIARLRPAPGRLGDFHEFVVTPRGTALITVYRPVPYDLSALGGPVHGTLLESFVQEMDIKTGRVLLRWRASDHVDLTDSHEEMPTDPDDVFDFFHVNSIDVDHDGNLLVSSRHTDTVYKIDRDTGKVIWRLGGKRSDFTFGPGARFHSQHDALRQPDGDITLFDNSNPPQVREHSRAIRLHVDENTMTATLVSAIKHPLGLSSESQGNVQTLPGGSRVVGWGSEPYFSRFGADGALSFDAHFPADTDGYRTFEFPWSSRGEGRPAISVKVDDDLLTVFASWNGSTEVARWQVLGGPRPGDLHQIASDRREGFETMMTAETHSRYVAVRAASGSGRALGRSEAVSTAKATEQR